MTNKKITAATTDAKFEASDEQMLLVESRYRAFENDLLCKVANVESDFPGYHEYKYDIAGVGHDPYVLISICSAVKANFTADDPKIIDIIHEAQRPRRQYTLAITKEVAPEFAEAYGGVNVDNIDRKYVDLHVKLTNYDLHCIIDSILTHDQLAHYAGYIRNYGGRPDLFPKNEYPGVIDRKKFMDYQINESLYDKYPIFKREMDVALGLMDFPYVWGGSDEETSFDCSGFICYIMDQLGLRYRNVINGVERRLPVAGSKIAGEFYDGIYEKCQPVAEADRQPGDLIFFHSTFNASYRQGNLTHVGIYCGDEVFLACNSPYGVSYRDLDKIDDRGRNWRKILAGYGRLSLEEPNV